MSCSGADAAPGVERSGSAFRPCLPLSGIRGFGQHDQCACQFGGADGVGTGRDELPHLAVFVGSTPAKAVERLRIEVARQRVQSSGETIERIAQLTGFRDPDRMRRAFIRAFGHPPQSLRRAARVS